MKNIIILLITILFANTISAQNSRKISKNIASYFENKFEDNKPGVAALIVKSGKVLYSKGHGIANMEWNTKIETNTVFQIGSVTKLFTALATLQLIENNKLRLSDTIQKFVPSFPDKGYPITIAHLLTHSSGLKDYMTIDHPDSFILRKDLEPLKVIDFFKNEPLDFIPGEKSSYSNSGPFLLGYIIEVVSGLSYGEYLKKNIFEKAEMNNSYYGKNSNIIPNRAESYKVFNDSFKKGDYRSMSIPYSSGAILSTTEDIFKWQKALFNGTLIGKEFFGKMTNSYHLNNDSKSSFSLGGWFVDYLDFEKSSSLAHSGGISAFSSFIIYLPKEEILVIMLSNSNEINVQEMALDIARLALGENRGVISIKQDVLEAYIGKYSIEDNTDTAIALIKEIDGKLVLEVVDKFTLELSAINQTTFLVKNAKPKATIEFIKDDNGNVTKFIASQGGITEWEKVEE